MPYHAATSYGKNVTAKYSLHQEKIQNNPMLQNKETAKSFLSHMGPQGGADHHPQLSLIFSALLQRDG